MAGADSGRKPQLGFKRHFVWPGLASAVAEVLFIAVPLLNLFGRGVADEHIYRVALPVLAGAQILWWLAVGSWLRPIYRAIRAKRRGNRLSTELAASAYANSIRLPIYTLVLRTILWTGAAATIGFFLNRVSDWSLRNVVVMAAAAALLAFSVSTFRSLWYQLILARLRRGLFSRVPPLRRFADSYKSELVFATMVTAGATAAAAVAFVYFSLPIAREQFISLLTTLPLGVIAVLAVIAINVGSSTKKLDAFLAEQLDDNEEAETGERRSSPAPGPTTIYRLSQVLPYRSAALHSLCWTVVGFLLAAVARSEFRLQFDDSILLFGIVTVMAIGSSIYQALWHRGLLRLLLDHLTVRHRLPVRGIKPALSLRGKLLVSFGGMILFACGLALFWGFIQYKKLVTDFTDRQAELGMAWLRSEVSGAVAASDVEPTPQLVQDLLPSLARTQPVANAVFFYMPPGPDARYLSLGGGPIGAPTLPWYVRAQLRLGGENERMTLGSHSLSGRRGELSALWNDKTYNLGVVAVFYPSYRGRGVALVREIRDLLLFFLALFGVCGGIVLLTVAQFVKPIRRLEKRADGMARGELAQPVASGGEGDEIGRLTFALEEMRRALRDKLRSTEEVNLDLERAVQRRTADLAKKNRELAETLEKLTRAQNELVRSEKMASIGQLIAGIAHEINNPVNAIVNTVGPLSEAAKLIDVGSDDERAEAAEDLTDMLRVVRRGAERTKAIVSALHNYSRTDDESVVDVDINRSLDDSLELLRHLLKQDIDVVRDYSDIGRIRGHAGQLNQVFVNLVANAAQAVVGNDGATITIATRKFKDNVIIEIRDNGEGIDADVLPRIFDPFFTTKDVGEGSGLGLSIVHGIVERHDGQIEVDSSVGKGTAFTISLPASA